MMLVATMSYTVGVLLSIAAVAVIIAALVELSNYFRGRTIISGRQLLLRLVMAVLLLAIIGLGFWGKIYLSTGNPELITVAIAVGLGIVMFVAVVMLALLDLHQVIAAQQQARAELYRRLADMRQEIEEITKAKQGHDKTEQGPGTT